jgi:hypothetical protein
MEKALSWPTLVELAKDDDDDDDGGGEHDVKYCMHYFKIF